MVVMKIFVFLKKNGGKLKFTIVLEVFKDCHFAPGGFFLGGGVAWNLKLTLIGSIKRTSNTSGGTDKQSLSIKDSDYVELYCALAWLMNA